MEPLVSTTETRLADGGLLAIFAGVLLRSLVFFALTRENSLTDNHIIGAALLVILINLAGLFLPRALSAVPVFLGLLGWLYALSLAQKYSFIWKTGELPSWLVYGALGLALLSFILRGVLLRRWSTQIHGKGWAWIDDWAGDKSLRARVLAKKALVTLGYRRAREAGSAD